VDIARECKCKVIAGQGSRPLLSKHPCVRGSGRGSKRGAKKSANVARAEIINYLNELDVYISPWPENRWSSYQQSTRRFHLLRRRSGEFRARLAIFSADIESTTHSNSRKRGSLILPANIRHFPSEIHAAQPGTERYGGKTRREGGGREGRRGRG
jgi:hypothetical protein